LRVAQKLRRCITADLTQLLCKQEESFRLRGAQELSHYVTISLTQPLYKQPKEAEAMIRSWLAVALVCVPPVLKRYMDTATHANFFWQKQA